MSGIHQAISMFGSGGSVLSNNLILDLNADSLIGSLSNNDPVATWTDSSSAGNNATQSTSGNRPTFKTNQVNGHAAVDFATSKYMSLGSTITQSNVSVYLVVKLGSATGTKNIFGHTTGTAAMAVRVLPYLLRVSTPSDNDSTMEMPTAQFCQISITRNGTSGLKTTRVDECSFVSGTQNGGASVNFSEIGAHIEANFFNGMIARMLVYSVEHNSTERDAIEAELRTLYGLPDPAAALTDLTQVPGIQLWLKADAGVYKDAGSTLAANGETCQQWNDQSGNGNNATQATSGSRPTYATGSLNSLPVLQLDGSNDFMQVSSLTVGALMIVAKYGAATFSTYTAPFNDRTSAGGRVLLFESGTTSLFNPGISTYYDHFFRNGTLTNNDSPINSHHVMQTNHNTTITDACDVGRDDQDGSRCWNGEIAEIFVSNQCLSPAWRVKLKNYASNKWGV